MIRTPTIKPTPAQELRLATEEPADLAGRPSEETQQKRWQDGHTWLPCQVCKEDTKARHFVFEAPWSSKWVSLHMLCAQSEAFLSLPKQQHLLFAGEAVDGFVVEYVAIASKKARDNILDMLSSINKR